MAEEDDEDEGITIKVGGSPVDSPSPPAPKDLVLVTEPGLGSGGPTAPV